MSGSIACIKKKQVESFIIMGRLINHPLLYKVAYRSNIMRVAIHDQVGYQKVMPRCSNNRSIAVLHLIFLSSSFMEKTAVALFGVLYCFYCITHASLEECPFLNDGSSKTLHLLSEDHKWKFFEKSMRAAKQPYP